jgi:hypothetical protein
MPFEPLREAKFKSKTVITSEANPQNTRYKAVIGNYAGNDHFGNPCYSETGIGLIEEKTGKIHCFWTYPHTPIDQLERAMKILDAKSDAYICTGDTCVKAAKQHKSIKEARELGILGARNSIVGQIGNERYFKIMYLNQYLSMNPPRKMSCLR